ncbi:MAG: hypothetical protein ACLTCQ_13510 [Enterocloster bolteae]
MRQSLTLCLGVPYDIVQTNKKGECNICVALDFVDVDGTVVIVDVVVAVTTVDADVPAAAVTADADAPAAAATADVDAPAAAVTADVDAPAAAATADADAPAAAVTADAAAMISVPVPDARHTGKASAMAIGRALTMQPGAIQAAAALPPAQPEDLVQLSPKAAAAVTTNMN